MVIKTTGDAVQDRALAEKENLAQVGEMAAEMAHEFKRPLASIRTALEVLQGEGAIAKNRELMGATDPSKAAPGTIRKDFADSIESNVVHGSDAPETAAFEIGYFFNALEIVR